MEVKFGMFVSEYMTGTVVVNGHWNSAWWFQGHAHYIQIFVYMRELRDFGGMLL